MALVLLGRLSLCPRNAPSFAHIPPPCMRTCVRSMYAELHAHSAFSFLDGASLPDELATAAATHGYEAFALTDHNGVSGSAEFPQAASAGGVKALHGAEVDLEDGRHLTLLVDT